METGRSRWTDERIDDLALVVREEIRDLRMEIREGFREVHGDLRALRSETQAEFLAVRGEIGEVRGEAGMNRRLLMSMWLTTLLGFAALIVEAGLR